MNKSLSWKVLLPLGIALLLIGNFVFTTESIIGSSVALLGTLITIMGFIAGLRSSSKKKKEL